MVPCVPEGRGQIIARLIRGNAESCETRDQTINCVFVDETPAAANMLERVQDMYMAVLESEECVERIVCEMGGLVADAGYSKQMTK